jgi:hypothetical protein
MEPLSLVPRTITSVEMKRKIQNTERNKNRMTVKMSSATCVAASSSSSGESPGGCGLFIILQTIRRVAFKCKITYHVRYLMRDGGRDDGGKLPEIESFICIERVFLVNGALQKHKLMSHATAYLHFVCFCDITALTLPDLAILTPPLFFNWF